MYSEELPYSTHQQKSVHLLSKECDQLDWLSVLLDPWRTADGKQVIFNEPANSISSSSQHQQQDQLRRKEDRKGKINRNVNFLRNIIKRQDPIELQHQEHIHQHSKVNHIQNFTQKKPIDVDQELIDIENSPKRDQSQEEIEINLKEAKPSKQQQESYLEPRYKKIHKKHRPIKKRRLAQQKQQQAHLSITHQASQIPQHRKHIPSLSYDQQGSNSVEQDDGSRQFYIESVAKKRLTPHQLRITEQFQSIIKIVSHKNSNGDIEYRWELGSLRLWNNISNALKSNFYIFVKHSTKYRLKFEKYIPKKARIKQQASKRQTKILPNIKQQKIRETQIRNKSVELANLREIFNRIQIAKIIDYQKSNSSQHSYSEVDQNDYSEYEPQMPIIESMIEELVVRTNTRIAAKDKSIIISDSNQLKAVDQLLIYKLNKASQQFNYVNNIKSIFALNTKAPTLSCLTSEGLGLRSSHLKIISKETFQRQMGLAQTIILSESEYSEPTSKRLIINGKLQ